MLSTYTQPIFQPAFDPPSSYHYPFTSSPKHSPTTTAAAATSHFPSSSMPRMRSSARRQQSAPGPSSSSSASSSARARREQHPTPPAPPDHPIAPTEAIRMSEAAAARLPHSHSSSSPANAHSQRTTPPGSPAPHLDIANFPSADLMKLLAALLNQISAANDALRGTGAFPSASPPPPPPPLSHASSSSHAHTPSASHSHSPHTPHTPSTPPLSSASRASLTPSALLAFHARNVPAITIEAYLLRILKYCPAPNDVFLSLLVYFDRMSKLALDSTGRGFAIDSYNVHRLVIAGVTVASKFWSDVFYTNSRYAKVGGLPQPELNQLELQFLLLNDFRLHIPREEMQSYGDRLLHYSCNRERLQNAQTSGVGGGMLPPTPPDALQSTEGREEVREYDIGVGTGAARAEVEAAAAGREGGRRRGEREEDAMDVDEEGSDEEEGDEEEDEDETVRLHSSSASEVSTARGSPGPGGERASEEAGSP